MYFGGKWGQYWMNIIKTQVYCLLILLVVGIIFFRTKRVRTKSGDCFGVLIVATAVNLIFDMFSAYAVNHLETINPVTNRILHNMFLGSIISCLFLHALYIYFMIQSETGFKGKVPIFIYVPLAIGLMGITFAPLYYKITDTVNYSYGPAAYICYACMALYILLLVIYLLAYRSRIRRRKRIIVTSALGIYIVCSGYQAMVPTSLISGLGLVLAVFAIFLTVESPEVRLNELLQIEKQRISDANIAKSNFLAQMSHEVRTPINAILGMDEMILREYDEPQLNEYAMTIHHAGKMLLSQINNILDFTKIESGMTEIVEAEYNLCLLCGELVEIVNSRLKNKKIELITKIDEHLPAKLYGDNIKIKQIISNLLTNAEKYTNEGSIVFEVRMKERINSEVFMEIKVTDTGIGIREDDIPKLCESFRRLDEKRNRNIEGTGLGMCITQKYLELMDSSLQISSVYGEGSEFSFIIKQTAIGDEQLGDFKEYFKAMTTKKRKGYRDSFSAPDANIIMVDDNATNRVVFESLLKNTRIHINSLESGKECLEAVSKEHYDIIFLDHMMPELDGIATLQKLKKLTNNLCKDTPVIILTANTITSARNIYKQAGFNDYLSKPVLPNELERIMLTYLPEDKIQTPLSNIQNEKKNLISLRDLLGRIPEFDIDMAMKNCANKDILLQAVRGLYKSIDGHIECINRCMNHVDEDDIRKRYITEVHSVKSSIRLIGGVRLSSFAEELENAGNNGVTDFIYERTPDFLKELGYLKIQLQMCIPKQNIERVEIKKDKLLDLLHQLIKEMEVLNIDVADHLMEQLSINDWQGNRAQIFSKLQNAVQNLDYEETKLLVGILLEG